MSKIPANKGKEEAVIHENGGYSSSRRSVLKAVGAMGVIGTIPGVTSATEDSRCSDESFEILETTVADIHEAFATGRTTAREITKHYLDRIEAYDDQLNVVITLNSDAIQRAEELDEEFADSGPTGLLHGIPILLKDNIDTEDMPTTGGSVLFADTTPPDDAFITQQLRDAGGIILAKVNLGEFAYGSVSSLGGETVSPYDTEIQAGGSSAGSAAGTAANLGAISVGSDTGGSVRGPSSNNSLVGFRPTTGLVSRDGIIPLSSTLDTAGPMTRTVADNAVMLDVMSGYDSADSKTAESIGEIPEDGYVSYLNADGLDGARIGVPWQSIGTDDDEVVAIFEEALSAIEKSGATVVDLDDLPDIATLADEGMVISYEIEREINDYIASLGDEAPVESFREIVDSGTVEGVIAENTFPETEDIDSDALDENVDYLNALLVRRELHKLLYSAIAEYDLDAFVYETGYSSVPPVAAFPSVNVPAGFSEEALAVGIEFMAQPFEEPLLIELAYSFEQATMHRQPPEGFGPMA
ncbi:amidase family protein [Halalkalicoccus jeotgali]|nr:amidase family protein [Halalkalicoccus jeotgali]